MWVLFAAVYGLAKGARDLIKKKALQHSSAAEVLLLYTVAAFLLVLPDAPVAMQALPSSIGLAALKAGILFIAFLCSFNAIKNLPVGLYGIVDLSRMLFSILLSVVFLQEVMGPWQVTGMVLVAAGILLLKAPTNQKNAEKRDTARIYIILAFVQSFLNACSGVLDKVAMKQMTEGQLQFWFMLFLALFYTIYAICTRVKIQWKSVWKNYWIWLISILFVFSDRILFLANGMEESQVVIMTLLKRSGCFVTILGGRLFFKEKNTGRKLLCAAVVLVGILLAVLLPA